jgi:hypothetical protein|tara:strand:+ start:65 stop:367 length:303 start_codon:yes stop_codon:yes gene_type:complete
MSKGKKVADISGDAPTDEKTNGISTRDIYFSLEQADLAKNLLQSVNECRSAHIDAQSKWEAFLIGIGMQSGDEIVGGDLDSNDSNNRFLTVSRTNGIVGQ